MAKLINDFEADGKTRKPERTILFERSFGKLRIRLSWHRPSSYGTRGSRKLSLDTSWHDRDSWIFGAGHIGNRTSYLGWRLKGHRDRHGFNEPRPRTSFALFSRSGNLPYCG